MDRLVYIASATAARLETAQAVAANNLANANRLRIGQVLRIPPAAGETLQTAAKSKPKPRIHVVKSGQTLSAIARLHGVTTRQIADTNQLADANTLRPGQRLRIPQG